MSSKKLQGEAICKVFDPTFLLWDTLFEPVVRHIVLRVENEGSDKSCL